MPEELVHGQTNVFDDLAKQDRRDVAAGMEGNRCATSVRMTILLVGPALSHFLKAQVFQYPDDLARFKYRNITHDYATTTF